MNQSPLFSFSLREAKSERIINFDIVTLLSFLSLSEFFPLTNIEKLGDGRTKFILYSQSISEHTTPISYISEDIKDLLGQHGFISLLVISTK